MKNFRYLLTVVFITAIFFACREETRFSISSSDKTIPGVPVVNRVVPLNGGARIFYTPPTDEDLLFIACDYVAPNGKTFTFSSSYFKDSLDVYGLGETKEYTLNLYSEDRTGNKSTTVPIKVTPLESTIKLVVDSLVVRSGFNSFYLQWSNPLQQSVNVIVNFQFDMEGVHRDLIQVFSSNLPFDRQFINDLNLGPDQPVNMQIHVEDIYGNATTPVEVDGLILLQDSKIPKDNWVLPNANDSIAGIPMCFGNGADGRIWRVIDDMIDTKNNVNYMNAQDRGRTGVAGIPDANLWNFIIDLGDYYELSRIITWQRHSGGDFDLNRGEYYMDENVGHYRLYYLDEAANQWVFISEHYIPMPIGLTDMQIIQRGMAGDQEYMYPDNPGFTPPVRWFRYEAVNGFPNNYTSIKHNCLSEITLFGRPASAESIMASIGHKTIKN